MNKTNSENGHLVFSIFKKKQENNGVGDISSLFQRHCQTNDNEDNKDEISPTPLFSCFFLNIKNTRCGGCRGFGSELRKSDFPDLHKQAVIYQRLFIYSKVLFERL